MKKKSLKNLSKKPVKKAAKPVKLTSTKGKLPEAKKGAPAPAVVKTPPVVVAAPVVVKPEPAQVSATIEASKPPVINERVTMLQRMIRVMGTKNMRAKEVAKALIAQGIEPDSGNLVAYVSTMFCTHTPRVFKKVRRGIYRVMTPGDENVITKPQEMRTDPVRSPVVRQPVEKTPAVNQQEAWSLDVATQNVEVHHIGLMEELNRYSRAVKVGRPEDAERLWARAEALVEMTQKSILLVRKVALQVSKRSKSNLA